MIGRCAACPAKDSEIAFLREQVKSLMEKLTNMADPLLQARLHAADLRGRMLPNRETTPNRTGPATHSVQMLRQAGREDRQPGLPDKPAAPTPEEVEARFEKRSG